MPTLKSSALLVAVIAMAGCKNPNAPPPKKEPITAKIAYRPVEPGTSFRASMEAATVVGKKAGRKLKKIGVFRAQDVSTELTTSFYAELVSRGPATKWQLDFDTFSSRTEGTGSKTAESTYDLPKASLTVTFPPEGEPAEGEAPVETTVVNKEGEPATESQAEIAIAIAEGLQDWEPWGKFLSSRAFEQGKITEAPKNLYIGSLAEAFYGPVSKAHTTVSLFRLGLEDGNEVAHFDVHSEFRSGPAGKAYDDFRAKGRMVVRVVDGTLLSYEIESKVTPRSATGEMLPGGSGKFTMSYLVDPASVPVR